MLKEVIKYRNNLFKLLIRVYRYRKQLLSLKNLYAFSFDILFFTCSSIHLYHTTKYYIFILNIILIILNIIELTQYHHFLLTSFPLFLCFNHKYKIIEYLIITLIMNKNISIGAATINSNILVIYFYFILICWILHEGYYLFNTS